MQKVVNNVATVTSLLLFDSPCLADFKYVNWNVNRTNIKLTIQDFNYHA